MLPLDDARWNELTGAFGTPFDPRPALSRLESDDPTGAWEELWANLHDEGDVGVASYATVPHVVRIVTERGTADWNTFALAGTVELARDAQHNPDLPDWLTAGYESAWEKLFELARDQLATAVDTVTLRCLLGAIAVAKGDLRRGRVLLEYDDEELDGILGEFELDDDDLDDEEA